METYCGEGNHRYAAILRTPEEGVHDHALEFTCLDCGYVRSHALNALHDIVVSCTITPLEEKDPVQQSGPDPARLAEARALLLRVIGETEWPVGAHFFLATWGVLPYVSVTVDIPEYAVWYQWDTTEEYEAWKADGKRLKSVLGKESFLW